MQDILKLINENQVVLISGGTGCGKSTQIPQYILEDYALSNKGSECNILMSQPRRISATSIAQRIADERCERLGVDSHIGYHIAFDSVPPFITPHSCLLATSGVILRKLQANATNDFKNAFFGVSHVIIDEVHEHHIESDIFLSLVKKIIQDDKKIKVILMSATLNSTQFCKYFNDCPVIEIPGRQFPVTSHYLDEIKEKLKTREATQLLGGFKALKGSKSLDLKICVSDIVSLLEYVHNTKPQGAILVFLPGWNEIKEVETEIKNYPSLFTNCRIHLLHSLVSAKEQRAVFIQPSAISNTRKIILATNVAETSITINDVVYVIDSGLAKEVRVDSEARKSFSYLCTTQTSKSSCLQRRGRAGRTRPGTAYHLYTEEDFNSLSDYTLPEILNSPLENTILRAKPFCYDGKSLHNFFSSFFFVPPELALNNAILNLKSSHILDDEECLTPLGVQVSQMPCDCGLGLLLILGSFFGISELCSLTVALLSTVNIVSPLTKKTEFKRIKSDFMQYSNSDCIAMINLFQKWFAIAEGKGVQHMSIASRQFYESEVENESTVLPSTSIIDDTSPFLGPSFLKKSEQLFAFEVENHVNSEAMLRVLKWKKNVLEALEKKKLNSNFTKSNLVNMSSPFSNSSHFCHSFIFLQTKLSKGLIKIGNISQISPLFLLLLSGQELKIKNANGSSEKVSFSTAPSKFTECEDTLTRDCERESQLSSMNKLDSMTFNLNPHEDDHIFVNLNLDNDVIFDIQMKRSQAVSIIRLRTILHTLIQSYSYATNFEACLQSRASHFYLQKLPESWNSDFAITCFRKKCYRVLTELLLNERFQCNTNITMQDTTDREISNAE